MAYQTFNHMAMLDERAAERAARPAENASASSAKALRSMGETLSVLPAEPAPVDEPAPAEDLGAALEALGLPQVGSPAAAEVDPLADNPSPVDLEGAPPNIYAMRRSLGLEERAKGNEYDSEQSEEEAPSAWTPGVGVIPESTEVYELHRDYDLLLRNPDGSSVVGRMLGAEESPDPNVPGQRVAATPPRVDVGADAKTIDAQARLSDSDRAKMNALAAVEGKLRGQDYSAWGYPVHMTPEHDMPMSGLPWDHVDAAVLRGPDLDGAALETISAEVNAIPVPDGYQADSMEELVAVVPAPDGKGGALLMNTGLDNDIFQEAVRVIRGNHQEGLLQSEWGTYDANYITDFDKVIRDLPADLQDKAKGALKKLKPMAKQISRYHTERRPPRVESETAPTASPLEILQGAA